MMSHSSWNFFNIALLVTGKGESQFLAKLFRSLEAEGHCHFEVAAKVEQLQPITSPIRIKQMVGTGKSLTSRDEQLGLRARNLLSGDSKFHFIILIDDLEHDRRDHAQMVFARYRKAFDTMLAPVGLSANASVHFLVNMLEAYYFADAASINNVAVPVERAMEPPLTLSDHQGDVEAIRHPKNELKRLWHGFDEVLHGKLIVEQLEVHKVLSDPKTCRSLRTMLGWCSKAIGPPFTDVYQLERGEYFDVTREQIEALDSGQGAS